MIVKNGVKIPVKNDPAFGGFGQSALESPPGGAFLVEQGDPLDGRFKVRLHLREQDALVRSVVALSGRAVNRELPEKAASIPNQKSRSIPPALRQHKFAIKTRFSQHFPR